MGFFSGSLTHDHGSMASSYNLLSSAYHLLVRMGLHSLFCLQEVFSLVHLIIVARHRHNGSFLGPAQNFSQRNMKTPEGAITLFINDQQHVVHKPDPNQSLVDYITTTVQLQGTKSHVKKVVVVVAQL